MALPTTPASEALYAADILRTEPVQARSSARLTALLDSAALVIHDTGYETLTTAAVANRAGASIGTVYRYFPDRIVLLQSLALRNAERAQFAVYAGLDDKKVTDIASAFDAIADAIIVLFRQEPGFRSLRLGDVLDLRPFEAEPAVTRVSRDILGIMSERFGVAQNDANHQIIEASFVTLDALLGHAFATNGSGSKPFIDAAKSALATAAAQLSE